jgi:hypothetical protein
MAQGEEIGIVQLCPYHEPMGAPHPGSPVDLVEPMNFMRLSDKKQILD